MKAQNIFFFFDKKTSITFLIVKIWSTVEYPGLKPAWFSLKILLLIEFHFTPWRSRYRTSRIVGVITTSPLSHQLVAGDCSALIQHWLNVPCLPSEWVAANVKWMGFRPPLWTFRCGKGNEFYVLPNLNVSCMRAWCSACIQRHHAASICSDVWNMLTLKVLSMTIVFLICFNNPLPAGAAYIRVFIFY